MLLIEMLRKMGRKKSTADWIKEAKAIWGNKFDYSKAVYITRRDKITIGCRNCGFIEVIAGNHIISNATRQPAGCDTCRRAEAAQKLIKPFSQMVDDARKVHGDRYEYFEESYKGAKATMEMLCPTHGIVPMIPDTHINRKAGCRECAKTKKATETLATRFTELQDKIATLSQNTVTLSFDGFKGQNFDANFKCAKHGNFNRKPIQSLLTRHPCIYCLKDLPNSSNTLSASQISKRVEKLDGKFEIQSIEGEGKLAKIKILCLENKSHNPLNSTTLENLYGKSFACPKCAHEAGQPKRTESIRKLQDTKRVERGEEWRLAAIKFHGHKYDYSKSNYIDAHTEVLIGCPVHGFFSQIAATHLSAGCRLCADEELKGRYTETYFERYPEEKIVPALLYHIKFSLFGKCYFKVGITKTSVQKRFSAASGKGVVYKIIKTTNLHLYEAFWREQKILDLSPKTIQTTFTQEQKDFLKLIRIGTSELIDYQLSNAVLQEYYSD
jgi:hypothetical protein